MSDPIGPDSAPVHSTGGNAGDGGQGGSSGTDGRGTTGGEDGGGAPPKTAPDHSWWIPFFVGVAMLTGYAVFLSFMMDRVDAKDPDWSRLVYLFSGVEALAFGAAGFFFGREVHRGRAEAAENRADAQSRRATTSEKDATKSNARLQTLAELADGAPVPHRGGMESAHLSTAGADAAVDARVRLETIAQLARTWSPRT